MSLFDKDYYFDAEEELNEQTYEELSCEWDNYMNEGFDIYSVSNCIVLQEKNLKKKPKLYDIKEEISIDNLHDFSFQEEKFSKTELLLEGHKEKKTIDIDSPIKIKDDNSNENKFENLNKRLVDEFEVVKERLQNDIRNNNISFDDNSFSSNNNPNSKQPIIINTDDIQKVFDIKHKDNMNLNDYNHLYTFNSLASTEKKKIENKPIIYSFGNLMNSSPKFKVEAIDDKLKKKEDLSSLKAINKTPMIYNEINDRFNNENFIIQQKLSTSPNQSLQKECFEMYSLSNISLSLPNEGNIKKNDTKKNIKAQIGLYHHQKHLKEFANNSYDEGLMKKKDIINDNHYCPLETCSYAIKQAYWFSVKDNIYYDYLITKHYKDKVSIANEISVFYPKGNECDSMVYQSKTEENHSCKINKEDQQKDNDIMKLNKQVNAYKAKNELMQNENNELIEAISLLKKISSTIDSNNNLNKDNVASLNELLSPSKHIIHDKACLLPVQIKSLKSNNSRNNNMIKEDSIIASKECKSITSTKKNDAKYSADYLFILKQKDKRQKVVKQLEEILFNIKSEEAKEKELNKNNQQNIIAPLSLLSNSNADVISIKSQQENIILDKGKEKESLKDSEKETFKDSDREKEEEKEIIETPSDNSSFAVIPYHLITLRKLYENLVKASGNIPIKEQMNFPLQKNTRSNSQKSSMKLI